MTQLFAKFVAVVAFTLGLSSASQAAPSFLTFEGEFIDFHEPYIEAGLRYGDKIYGGLTFDSNTPDLLPLDPIKGEYNALFGFIIVPTLNTFWTFGGPNNIQRITVQNNFVLQYPGFPEPQPPIDTFGIHFQNAGFGTVPTHQFTLLGEGGPGIFASDSLPTTLPDPSEPNSFGRPVLFYEDLLLLGPHGHAAIAELTQWTIFNGAERPLPEPGTVALLSLGLAGLALTRRRKQ